jgi:hypothetical protein
MGRTEEDKKDYRQAGSRVLINGYSNIKKDGLKARPFFLSV